MSASVSGYFRTCSSTDFLIDQKVSTTPVFPKRVVVNREENLRDTSVRIDSRILSVAGLSLMGGGPQFRRILLAAIS